MLARAVALTFVFTVALGCGARTGLVADEVAGDDVTAVDSGNVVDAAATATPVLLARPACSTFTSTDPCIFAGCAACFGNGQFMCGDPGTPLFLDGGYCG